MDYSLLPKTELNALAILRSLVPKRPVPYHEALRVAEQQADSFRELLQTNTPAFPHERIMELPKIEVVFDMHITVSASAHWSGKRWIIVINGNETPFRQRFSLAHELKHILDHSTRHFLYHGDCDTAAAEQAEKAADFFAGCLLMPTEKLKQLYEQGITLPIELAKHFKTSAKSIRCRLRQIGLAGEKSCPNWDTNEGNLCYSQPANVGVGI